MLSRWYCVSNEEHFGLSQAYHLLILGVNKFKKKHNAQDSHPNLCFINSMFNFE